MPVELQTRETPSSALQVRIVPRALAFALKANGGFAEVKIIEIETREVL